jgi:phosphate starvation-inducible PhoH-like protein
MTERIVHFESPRALSLVHCGREENITLAEQRLGVKLVARDDWLSIVGDDDKVALAESFFEALQRGRGQGLDIRQTDFENMLRDVTEGRVSELLEMYGKNAVSFHFKKKSIVPKTIGQKNYAQAIRTHDVVFGIGPAGTGKTYLAVASALDALMKGEVDRLVLTRPAVEAGEALGYLPGDLEEKIQPYLRPLYDSMFDMLGHDHAKSLMEKESVEIAPLAYMRGRTLSHSFVILDEAQNTTPEQMMMFLTRLGEGSRMVITGDITQIDLPRHKYSGLKEAIDVLEGVPGVAFHYFDTADVVRHPLVARIIEAYQHYMDATGAHQRRESSTR